MALGVGGQRFLLAKPIEKTFQSCYNVFARFEQWINKKSKKTKKEDYYIFKFKSNSDNLSDDLKDKYLIGWSNNGGGTFSNFDLYENFEEKTIEKTLKKIKKKLL